MRQLSRAESVAWRLDALPACRRAGLVVLLLERAPTEASLQNALRRAIAHDDCLGGSIEPSPCDILPPALLPAKTTTPPIRPLAGPGSAPLSYQALLDILDEKLREPFAPGEPLFRVFLASDLGAGDAAVVFHLHPLAAGRLGWLANLLDGSPAEEEHQMPAEPPAADDTAAFSRLLAGVRSETATWTRRSVERLREVPGILRDPGAVLAEAQRSLEELLGQLETPTRPSGGNGSSHLSSFSLRWDDLAETARVADCEPLDVVRAGVALTLLARGQTSVRARLDDAAMPWLPQAFDMPLDGAAGRSLLAKVKSARLRAANVHPAYRLPEWSELADRIPANALAGLLGSGLSPGDLRCEYVAGLPVNTWLAGVRVEAIRTFNTRCSTRVAASLVRSHDDAAIGLTLDPQTFPEPVSVVQEMRERFRALLAIAG